MAYKRLSKSEREQKENMEYRNKTENIVNAIIATGEQAGKTYTKFDRMWLLAFHDERNISDYNLNKEIERIDELEKKENELR